jgi:hypothetical protein
LRSRVAAKVKDEQLAEYSPSRGARCRVRWSSPTPTAEIYRRSGRYDVRVNPEIIEQLNNRVDLVFTITEGGKPASNQSSCRQQRIFVVSSQGYHQDA